MGNKFSTTTLGSTKDSQGYTYWVGIDWKPFFKGSRKNCYHGYLNGQGPRAGEKVVVKSFSDSTGTQETWKEEMLKAKMAQFFADSFSEHLNFVKINVNLPQVALMDTVSKMANIYEGRGRSKSLNKDEWVSIEENITGEFQRFCGNDRTSCTSVIMNAFTHFTFYKSCGQLIVCDLQGVMDGDTFHVTDPLIYSVLGSFGKTDKGVQGINEFFKFHRCNSICNQWPKMLPLSPPPSFEDIPTMLLMSSRLTPTAPLYENVCVP